MIRSPSLMKGASSIRLYKDSTVVYSSRKNYDLACGMVSFAFILFFLSFHILQDFRKFPFDNQTCELVIHSYGSSIKDYTLKWGLVRQMFKSIACMSLSSRCWTSTGLSTRPPPTTCPSSRWTSHSSTTGHCSSASQNISALTFSHK